MYGDFESWQKAELSSPVKKRKREGNSEEKEVKRRRFWELYFYAENHCNKYIVKRHAVSSFFVLASSRVMSGIMYRTAVIIGKISPSASRRGPVLPVMAIVLYIIPYITHPFHLRTNELKK